jgi:hypothetical protein
MKIKKVKMFFCLYFDFFVVILSLITAILLYKLLNVKIEVLGAIIATGISLSFGIRQYKIENDKMFKELFQEFNLKYDKKFNKTLNKIDKKIKRDLSVSIDKKRDLIIDYINFCSEEYLWYKKKRIPLDVWTSWKKGMLYFLNLPPIKEIVLEQYCQKDSYYGLFDELFPDLKGNNK